MMAIFFVSHITASQSALATASQWGKTFLGIKRNTKHFEPISFLSFLCLTSKKSVSNPYFNVFFSALCVQKICILNKKKNKCGLNEFDCPFCTHQPFLLALNIVICFPFPVIYWTFLWYHTAMLPLLCLSLKQIHRKLKLIHFFGIFICTLIILCKAEVSEISAKNWNKINEWKTIRKWIKIVQVSICLPGSTLQEKCWYSHACFDCHSLCFSLICCFFFCM